MTTAELVQEVLDHQFSPERYSTRIVNWLSKAQSYIVRQSDVRMASVLQTSVLIPGQYDYELPDDFARVINLAIYQDSNTDATFLRHMELEDFIIADSEVSTPYYYTLNRENLYSLYPAPNVAYFLDFYYYGLPADLSVETGHVVNPVIPEDYHDLLIDYALHRAYASEHDSNMSSFHKNLFDAAILKLRGELQFEDNTGARVVEGTWANLEN